ncbi:MAG: Arm DNA-binding domain-containing protein [Chloroflexi bacterium]|nr:Arm DNA-binding domain-containing protein [Chloroflexota bacterium]
MARLTATAVDRARPEKKPYKLADGGSMYLLVHPSGSKYWRYDYSFDGKRKTYALGVYPDTSLASARKAHLQARESLASGTDPGGVRKSAKLTQQTAVVSRINYLHRKSCTDLIPRFPHLLVAPALAPQFSSNAAPIRVSGHHS